MDGNCACGTCRWTLKGEDLLGLAGKRRPPALGSSPAPSHSAPANGSPCVSPSRGGPVLSRRSRPRSCGSSSHCDASQRRKSETDESGFFRSKFYETFGKKHDFSSESPKLPSPRPMFPSKQTPRVREAQLFCPGKAASPRVSACAFASALVT